jgi:hypothetical protein
VNDHVVTTYAGSPAAMTLSAWVRPDPAGTSRPRIAQKPGEFELLIDKATNVLVFGRQFSGSWAEWRTPAGSLPSGAWRHVAVAYDRSSPANDPVLYIDGVVQALTETSSPSGAASLSSAAYYLGSVGGTTRYLDGALDEVKVHTRLLTPQEVQQEFRRSS